MSGPTVIRKSQDLAASASLLLRDKERILCLAQENVIVEHGTLLVQVVSLGLQQAVAASQ